MFTRHLKQRELEKHLRRRFVFQQALCARFIAVSHRRCLLFVDVRYEAAVKGDSVNHRRSAECRQRSRAVKCLLGNNKGIPRRPDEKHPEQHGGHLESPQADYRRFSISERQLTVIMFLTD